MPGKKVQQITSGEFEVLRRVQIKNMEFVKIGSSDPNSFATDSYYLVNGNNMTLTQGFDEIWVSPDGTVVGSKLEKNYEIKSDGTIPGEYHPGTDYFDAQEIHD